RLISGGHVMFRSLEDPPPPSPFAHRRDGGLPRRSHDDSRRRCRQAAWPLPLQSAFGPTQPPCGPVWIIRVKLVSVIETWLPSQSGASPIHPPPAHWSHQCSSGGGSWFLWSTAGPGLAVATAL